ncbi:beta-N-acetylhexosaminidase [Paenibacillus sp. IB182496]|uniref:Beta-N-acetylhexosaminidase n=1 Tax=Paenibacillus sabuli TaxID=2772509 RepID=A0A927BRB6_9BACL|nr:beta-N-acetylhexosaminidase [Paenibacillus sabuli]MBD2845321.1 beta-N-acetylhexosaminidase [Paenibacillus sabuli]
MKMCVTGDVEGLLPGISALEDTLGVSVLPGPSADALHVRLQQREGPLEVSRSGSEGVIGYACRAHFFRGLGLFVQLSREGEVFTRTEQPQFDWCGAMFDASRNGVLHLDSLQRLLRTMAVMGFNGLMLYTEDTYTVEDAPYFGYMRGRYSHEELRAADDYADMLGIEIVPCIQTLAHLGAALQWDYAAELRDTDSILLAGKEETYRWIERMIRAASAPLRSRRIHIGMDEAHELGRGRYLDENGHVPRFEIMKPHLRKVLDIAEAQGLSPMIWSDMFFRIVSPDDTYYNLENEIPDSIIAEMPKDTQYVYWDYYHDDTETYRELLRRHKRFGSTPMFAGGVWTWSSVTPNYGVTFANTNAALEGCKQEGVREVLATLWGNDGQETSHFAGLLGLQLYAEHSFVAAPTEEWVAQRFAFCTGGVADDYRRLGLIDEVPGVAPGNPIASNPAKFLLWQDVLLGLFDRNVADVELTEHYARLEKELRPAISANPGQEAMFAYYVQLCGTLKLKWDFGLKAQQLYAQGDKDGLTGLTRVLDELHERVTGLRKVHKVLWFANCKPQGWEVLDIRYGGVLTRISTARERLMDYVRGVVERLEELEEERLRFDWRTPAREGTLGRCYHYQRIATANLI